MEGVAVEAAEGVAARVELGWDVCDRASANVEREEGIRTARERIEGEATAGVEGGDLPLGVYAGIGAAGQRDPDGLAGQVAEGPFERGLHRRRVGLQLGAGVGSALIFEEEGKAAD
jgi:hypothetical protein